ncbi:phosphate ABC transporter ATP-binding protein [Laribacter hongkongensis]|uniref:Phosphate ABC transporter ATP-binding protein n=1 Tax=Laribacter hongkongensis TaxID=168471 RepID=A0ABD4SSN6_9NEIS|nr:phosphate ABC transporter ATP-binding protein [Laribacter hongkongensis]MCG9026781.1 phosphate ABC transporter ATP-binding protein [Laribacter hongkongensis]MCG9125488.1 phosphate ABC transporter ATP-binding protein [Laribacter hongkongensis]
MTAIECRGLRVTLQGQRLLDDISLSVPAGQIAVLTGPSGSGKTTLLRTLNRLLDRDQAEVSGTLHLRVGGRMLAPYDRSTDPVWLRRRVGMVFQTPHLLPGSIADNLLLPLRLVRAGSRAALAGRMEEALRAAHVWDEVAGRLHAPAASLSGGQQQRLCLARALALEPDILLLDEPTASLDPASTVAVEQSLKALRGQTTLLLVSHDEAQAARLADLRVHLQGGRLA